MLIQIITCDYCGKLLDKNEEYFCFDGYRTQKGSDSFLDDIHFHPECWEKVSAFIKRGEQK